MKLTTFILMISLMQVSAASFGQQLTMKDRNASIDKVFREIRKQTGYSVVLRKSELNTLKKIAVDFSDATLEQVMDKVLEGTETEYFIEGKSILVVKKEKSFFDKVINRLKTIDVRGKVVDEKGVGVAGALVKVKGKNISVITQSDGVFFIKGIEDKSILIISFIGFESVEIPASESIGEVKLIPSTTSLSEVIINKGYYTESQRLSVSNVIKVSQEDIEKQPISNPLLALQGRVPGLSVLQSAGLPGSGVTVRIQGQNSITKGNDPLYVIDGVPYTSQFSKTNLSSIQGNSGGALVDGAAPGSGNPLTYINPNDIASIEVLKDADATSLYGSRAANGAILITTKKGRPGNTQINIKLESGIGEVERQIKLLNTQQYLSMRKEALKNDGINPDPTYDYDLTLWDQNSYTDWQKQLIGGNAKYTDIYVNASGGSENIQFSLGGTAKRQTTVFQGDFKNQTSGAHFTLNSVSNDRKLTILMTANYVNDKNKLPQADMTSSALQLSPNAPSLYDTNGEINWMPDANGTSSWINPLAGLEGKYLKSAQNLIGSLGINYTLFPSLSLRTNFGYNYLTTDENAQTPLSAVQPEQRPSSSRYASYAYNSTRTWISEPQINYQKAFGKHNIEALLGTTFQETKTSGQTFFAQGFNNDLSLQDIRSASSLSVLDAVANQYKYQAIYSRISYRYNNKYILNFSARRDGSSRFGPSSRFHNFWSIGGAWIFSEENWVKKNLGFLNFGKLKSSYGTTGNDQIGDYQYMDLYSTPVDANYSIPYQGNSTTLAVSRLSNAFLQWEETKKFQIGLSLGFLKDLIVVDLDYINNRSSNQLLGYSLPITTGLNTITVNFPASIQNSAYEGVFNFNLVRNKNLKWNVGLNFTLPNNKLVDFPNLSTSNYKNLLVIGQPLSITKLYRFAGVSTTTGQYMFYDNKNAILATPNNINDKIEFINTLPKLYGGFQNTVGWKNFEMSFLIQFTKQKGQNDFGGPFTAPGVTGVNQTLSVLNGWKNVGDNSSIQRSNSDFSLLSAWSSMRQSTIAYSDASFLKLKNVSLSWNTPETFTKKVHLRSFRLFTHAQNVFTLTKYFGLDPESQSLSSLPSLRVITFGAQIGL